MQNKKDKTTPSMKAAAKQGFEKVPKASETMKRRLRSSSSSEFTGISAMRGNRGNAR